MSVLRHHSARRKQLRDLRFLFFAERRYLFGGAHWSQVGRGRLGVVVTLEQSFQPSNDQLLGRRLLVQTQIQF